MQSDKIVSFGGSAAAAVDRIATETLDNHFDWFPMKINHPNAIVL